MFVLSPAGGTVPATVIERAKENVYQLLLPFELHVEKHADFDYDRNVEHEHEHEKILTEVANS